MCGAFSILHPFKEVGRRFNAGYNLELNQSQPRYNVRPSQPIPVVFNTNPEEISLAFWGVHPAYDKTKKLFFINARNDSLNKNTWHKMFLEQRCLIPADGFYEWEKGEGKTKIPYRFELKDQGVFAFAGLWQEETGLKGDTAPHAVIITTTPNSLVAEVHDRMPAILKMEEESTWLNPDTNPEELENLLKPISSNSMKKFQVSTLVNSASNDTKEIINEA